MRTALLAAVIAVLPFVVLAQEPPSEKQPPADSSRVSIPGCSRGRVFIVGETPEHEPMRSDVQPGRRFRLNGPRTVLADIKKQEGTMIEVTGLVRKSDLRGPKGIPIPGGRVTIGGAVPRAPMGGGMTTSPMVSQAVLDIESWRPLAGPCPRR